MIDKLTNIDEKIQHLKKRREKVQTQQAIFFMREAQKIFQDSFSPEIALSVLSEIWNSASETQKQNWRKRGRDFRPTPLQNNRQKTQTIESEPQQS